MGEEKPLGVWQLGLIPRTDINSISTGLENGVLIGGDIQLSPLCFNPKIGAKIRQSVKNYGRG